ncbi:hypothetical protein DFJ74DRAFT_669041 [Hyaloraphidium curvatum]|nr:hypothetical protein DFJ74DRAFT_669041 [Hyaloraphidium curvatum]
MRRRRWSPVALLAAAAALLPFLVGPPRPPPAPPPPPRVPCGLRVLLIASPRGNRTYGSTVMRGHMVAESLSRLGIPARVAFENDHSVWEGNLRGTACVFLKRALREQLAHMCRGKGGAVVHDALDALPWYQEQGAKWADAVLANSAAHAAWLRTKGAREARVAWHHHSNVFGVRRDPGRPVKTVCFTGSPLNALQPAKEAALSAEARKHGLEYRFLPVPLEVESGEPGPPDDPYKQLVALRPLAGCDAGLIWPRDEDVFTLKLRPVTRLVTWWSVGVPTVFFPYAPYMEVSEGMPVRLAASSVEEVGKHLGWLADPKNAAEVKALVDEQLARAEKFTANALAPAYAGALCGIIAGLNRTASLPARGDPGAAAVAKQGA